MDLEGGCVGKDIEGEIRVELFIFCCIYVRNMQALIKQTRIITQCHMLYTDTYQNLQTGWHNYIPSVVLLILQRMTDITRKSQLS